MNQLLKDYIDKYTIDQAVKDQAVLPLLYEGRAAKLTVNQQQIDKGFDRLAEPLTDYQTKDLKQKWPVKGFLFGTF